MNKPSCIDCLRPLQRKDDLELCDECRDAAHSAVLQMIKDRTAARSASESGTPAGDLLCGDSGADRGAVSDPTPARSYAPEAAPISQ